MSNIQKIDDLEKYFLTLVDPGGPQGKAAVNVAVAISKHPGGKLKYFLNKDGNKERCSYLSAGKNGTPKTFTAFWNYDKETAPDVIDLLATGSHKTSDTYVIEYSCDAFFIVNTKVKITTK